MQKITEIGRCEVTERLSKKQKLKINVTFIRHMVDGRGSGNTSSHIL